MWKTALGGTPLTGLERTTEFLRLVSNKTDLSMLDEGKWSLILEINDPLTGYATNTVIAQCRPCVVEMRTLLSDTFVKRKLNTLILTCQ